ncbi:C-C chemokine receptor type 3-like [Oncorhynchus tshawytscha]|uniref:C-C chemokine receptor type 3-like n=1 Tax=Oncorhynchus tshawytscha TaxID=74940 RepID=UPI000D0A34D7|nr:C-C chemokine receptor type 3-like [Oncorhynchus tshawytscha]
MGNNLIFYIVCKLEKHDTVGNIFLLNLLMSDLVFMSSLPFWAVSHHMSSWVFGRAWCKIVGSNYFLGFYSSILFLTLMTFDRYLALHQAVHQALPEELMPWSRSPLCEASASWRASSRLYSMTRQSITPRG